MASMTFYDTLYVFSKYKDSLMAWTGGTLVAVIKERQL